MKVSPGPDERRGARQVVGIDNDLSRGATEFLIPYFESNVRMYETNILDMMPQKFGAFDIILCFGVLYHLRYPVWSLKKLVDCITDGGHLLIESGMLDDPRYEAVDFIYCPVEDSPYLDRTSCTFFNRKGLDTTMRSLGCDAVDCKTLGKDFVEQKGSGLVEAVKNRLRRFKPGARRAAPKVNRQFLTYRKNVSIQDEWLARYWDSIHGFHSTGKTM
jgi:SAM-dependent methyltransferase